VLQAWLTESGSERTMVAAKDEKSNRLPPIYAKPNGNSHSVQSCEWQGFLACAPAADRL